jgi:hypothetical protein
MPDTKNAPGVPLSTSGGRPRVGLFTTQPRIGNSSINWIRSIIDWSWRINAMPKTNKPQPKREQRDSIDLIDLPPARPALSAVNCPFLILPLGLG